MPAIDSPVVVLIVEDDRLVAQVMRQLIVSFGFVVDVADTIAEAIEKVGTCNVLLLDMNLPDGAGTEVLEYVRAHSLAVRVAVNPSPPSAAGARLESNFLSVTTSMPLDYYGHATQGAYPVVLQEVSEKIDGVYGF